MKIYKNSNINFTSGLNKSFIKKSQNYVVADLQKYLNYRNSTHFDFQNSKIVACCVNEVFNIFEILKIKTKSNLFNITTPNIIAYENKYLTFNFKGYGFCIPESQRVIIEEPPFETGSIFYVKENSIEQINAQTDKDFIQNKRASSHFLSNFIHEIFHEKYIDYIYKKYGYEGLCPYTKQKYAMAEVYNSGLKKMKILQKKTIDKRGNNIIKDILGDYATQKENQYHEIFAETFTKIICDSLSKDLIPVKNPFELLKKYSPEFLQIFYRILSF